MSSVVSTVYKRPSSVFTVRGNEEESSPVANGNLIITSMWIIIALVAATRSEFSSALSGFIYCKNTTIKKIILYCRNDNHFNCNRCCCNDIGTFIDDLGLRECKNKLATIENVFFELNFF